MDDSSEKRRKAARALLTPIEAARLERLQAARAPATRHWRSSRIETLVDKLDSRAEDRPFEREIAADTPQLVFTRESPAKPPPPFKRYVRRPICG
jgi:hypothetical protein